MNIYQHIPNLFTCSNLLCGCIGLVQATQGNLLTATGWLGFGLLFDFLDGLAARLLKAYSEMGKQLDSLADLVTFGLLPAFLIFQMFVETNYWAYSSFLITVCSALRLAKFNIDTLQSQSFRGLPTPANALWVASWVWISAQYYGGTYQWIRLEGMLGFIVLSCFLMVSDIELISLKFKDFSWTNNVRRYIFLILSLILLLLLQSWAITPIIVLYIGISLVKKIGQSNDRIETRKI